MSRARILLLKADGDSVDTISEKVALNRNSVLLCLKKYNAGGIENAIYDALGRERIAEITDEEKSRILVLLARKLWKVPPVCPSFFFLLICPHHMAGRKKRLSKAFGIREKSHVKGL